MFGSVGMGDGGTGVGFGDAIGDAGNAGPGTDECEFGVLDGDATLGDLIVEISSGGVACCCSWLGVVSVGNGTSGDAIGADVACCANACF